MLNVTELILLFLATNQAVEIWHHGKIMSARRDMVQQGISPFLPPAAIRYLIHKLPRGSETAKYVNDFVVDLLSCPYCTSVWVAAALFLLYQLAGPVGQFCTAALAVSRGANLLNDLTYSVSRTPKAQ